MENKYAVNDFMSGRIVTANSKEEAIQLFWQNVIKFIKLQYGNTMYFELQQNGNEYIMTSQNADILEQTPLTGDEILALFNTGEIPLAIRPNLPPTGEINLGN